MTPLLAAVPIPPLDPLGLPAPAWVFQGLMIVTMLLHLVFMNFTLGGVAIACGLDLLNMLRGGKHNLTVRVIWQMLPVSISFTITTGVAPLLFVQVLFGQFFYTATVFLGFTWLAIVPLLVIAFYLTYFVAYRLGNLLANRLGRWDRRPGRRLLLSLACLLLFGAVGWILTNLHMLSIQPDQWAAGGEWRQNRFQVTPMTTHPRFAHNLLGAVAVAGLCLAGVGWWRRARRLDPPEITEIIIRTGLWTFVPLAGLAAVFGVVFLFLMPRDVWQAMFSPNVFTVLWWIGLLGVLGQLLHGVLALQQPTQFKWYLAAAGSGLATLLGMTAGREAVRLAYLARAGAFSPQTWHENVHPQTSSLILFGVAFLVALATVAWLLWISARGRRAAAT